MRDLVHAEWTKLRTVRGWVIALLGAVAAIVALGVSPGMRGSCGTAGPASECVLAVGPGGEEVSDSFSFVRQPLTGDGSITVRVASLTGMLPQPDGPGDRPGVVPWAKAGLIVKDGTKEGSPYAAVMVTGAHGVRMQDNYVHDRAGSAESGSARWLRLTRTGDLITGAESSDGTQWTSVGTALLSGLPATVQIGLFVTSPQYSELAGGPLGASGAQGGPSRATAVFDHVSRPGPWLTKGLGGAGSGPDSGIEQTTEGFSVTGSGDIAPSVAGASGIGTSITQTLVGTFVGLVLLVVVGTMFATSEYRRGLIRTTMAASPRRGRVLVAKAIVLSGASVVVGLVAASIVVGVGRRVLQANGVYVHAVSVGTELRVVGGTAVLLALATVLAFAFGALLRRGSTAAAVAIAIIVLPYLLAVGVLPPAAGDWLLRVTPAAAFALQQSVPRYPQVDNLYTAAGGYFPLPGWAGLAVLSAWVAVALGLAHLRLRRSDV